MITETLGDVMPSPPDLIEYRLLQLEAERTQMRNLSETVIRLGDAMLEVKRDLDRGHTRMNEHDEEMDAQSERISVLEQAMPLLKETSDWVRRGVLGVFALVAIAVVGLVLKA